jgi:hypothetical protein
VSLPIQRKNVVRELLALRVVRPWLAVRHDTMGSSTNKGEKRGAPTRAGGDALHEDDSNAAPCFTRPKTRETTATRRAPRGAAYVGRNCRTWAGQGRISYDCKRECAIECGGAPLLLLESFWFDRWGRRWGWRPVNPATKVGSNGNGLSDRWDSGGGMASPHLARTGILRRDDQTAVSIASLNKDRQRKSYSVMTDIKFNREAY